VSFRPTAAPRTVATDNEAFVRVIAGRVAERMIRHENETLAPLLEHLSREQQRFEARLRVYRTDLTSLTLRLNQVEEIQRDRETAVRAINYAILAVTSVIAVGVLVAIFVRH